MPFNMPGYESLELSTQIIIKEAIKRNINIEVLDWSDNFIRLKKGNKIEYIKQATRTSLDSYISPLIMENKIVTKKILAENNIKVPEGKVFDDKKDALNSWNLFINKKIVIKPNSTNFGKGITILPVWLRSMLSEPWFFIQSALICANSSPVILKVLPLLVIGSASSSTLLWTHSSPAVTRLLMTIAFALLSAAAATFVQTRAAKIPVTDKALRIRFSFP